MLVSKNGAVQRPLKMPIGCKSMDNLIIDMKYILLAFDIRGNWVIPLGDEEIVLGYL